MVGLELPRWGAFLSDVSSSLEKKSLDDAFFILNPAMSEAGAPPGANKVSCCLNGGLKQSSQIHCLPGRQ